MKLTIDSLGEPIRSFEIVRDELVEAGKKFDPTSLAHIAYEKLAFCATGMAGAAMCPLKVVQEEKRSRRERFLMMSDTDIEAAKTLLQIEQMEEDVRSSRIREKAPRWEDLNPRMKAWFKLSCIANHLDDVSPRMEEALKILQLVKETHDLPPDFTLHQVLKLEGLHLAYPGMMSDPIFRTTIASLALEIKRFLPEAEQRICEVEVLYNYSCTSDCFSPLV